MFLKAFLRTTKENNFCVKVVILDFLQLFFHQSGGRQGCWVWFRWFAHQPTSNSQSGFTS